MSMNVNTTGTVYGSYQNTYKAGTVDKKKETAKTTENDKVKKNVTESIAEKNLSKEAQKMLKDMRGSRTDMDFMVADFENGDNAKDILAQSDKEFTVIFSKEEMEKMASDPKYYAEKMHSIEGALRMSDEINAQFGFERAFGKTNGIENSADTDTKITKFGISFNSDGTTTFFAQLEKHQLVRKNILKNSGKESCGEERGEEKGTIKAN
ncbi:MAG: DUF6033 family protein [Agathobacter rectalis]